MYNIKASFPEKGEDAFIYYTYKGVIITYQYKKKSEKSYLVL